MRAHSNPPSFPSKHSGAAYPHPEGYLEQTTEVVSSRRRLCLKRVSMTVLLAERNRKLAYWMKNINGSGEVVA